MKDIRSLPPLSPAEQALMDLVWQLQPINVSDLLEAVNRGRSEPIIRNTLQTQLKRLEAKGWLKRDDKGSIRLYQAAIAERPGRGKVLTELKHRLFGASGVTMIRCMMEDGGLTDREIQELNAIINQHQIGGEE